VSLAEGLLGRLAGFAKGWAAVGWEGSRLVWTHAQASYDRHPAAGAGRAGVGRAGQMQDLADDLGRSAAPVLVTGDLNALDGFASGDEEIRTAGEVDRGTLDGFFARTGIRFGKGPCAGGSFLGTVFRDRRSDSAIAGASLDRVGLNSAFEAAHPETRVACAEIAEGRLRVSDHRGLLITVPHR
jgi:endonuclease/exonuclease/phosphatase family metal-dependent hydrolase